MAKHSLETGLLAVLLAVGTSPSARSQDAQAEVTIDTDAPRVEASSDVDLPPTTPPDAETKPARDNEGVGAANKGSSIIGMEVKNEQGVMLGEIEDIVVDLPSGRISYVVLGVGGFLGIGEKLIAVPPSAFAPSEAGDELVLRADKGKIKAAHGFPRTNWPAYRSSSWGAQSLWSGEEAERPEGIQPPSPDREPIALETDAQIRTSPASDEPAKPLRSVDGADSAASFRGEVVSVDPERNRLVVRGDEGIRRFMLNDRATILIGGNSRADLAQLAAGDPVIVNYAKTADGELEVRSVTQGDPTFRK